MLYLDMGNKICQWDNATLDEHIESSFIWFRLVAKEDEKQWRINLESNYRDANHDFSTQNEREQMMYMYRTAISYAN